MLPGTAKPSPVLSKCLRGGSAPGPDGL